MVEFEQGGPARAEYGTQLLPILAESLGRAAFDVSNLRHMRFFYLAFPIRDALRPELVEAIPRTVLSTTRFSEAVWFK
jgi:hypothetical protein